MDDQDRVLLRSSVLGRRCASYGRNGNVSGRVDRMACCSSTPEYHNGQGLGSLEYIRAGYEIWHKNIKTYYRRYRMQWREVRHGYVYAYLHNFLRHVNQSKRMILTAYSDQPNTPPCPLHPVSQLTTQSTYIDSFEPLHQYTTSLFATA